MMKPDMKTICKSISWSVRQSLAYASYGVVESDDLWSAKSMLLHSLPELSFDDRRRLMNYYIDLLKEHNVVEQGLSF